jgi:hypothetical protein
MTVLAAAITAWCSLALYLGPPRAGVAATGMALVGLGAASSIFVKGLRRIALPAFAAALAGFALV